LVETVCRLMGDPDAVKSVTATVDALNLYPKTQVKLLNYLDDNADALVSGRSDGPASRLLLLRALTARYPGRVVAPRCSQCGRQVPLNRWAPTANASAVPAISPTALFRVDGAGTSSLSLADTPLMVWSAPLASGMTRRVASNAPSAAESTP